MNAQLQAHPAAICCICKCSLDIHAPHAIVKHEYCHLDCADTYDARDLGGIDLPEPMEYWTDEDESEFEED